MWIELAGWIWKVFRENVLYIIGEDVNKLKAKVSKLLSTNFLFFKVYLPLYLKLSC